MLIISGCYNASSITPINNEEFSIKSIDKDSVAYENVAVVTMLDVSVNEILNFGDVTVTFNGNINNQIH